VVTADGLSSQRDDGKLAGIESGTGLLPDQRRRAGGRTRRRRIKAAAARHRRARRPPPGVRMFQFRDLDGFKLGVSTPLTA
jgi:hypothetical protein